MAKFERTDATAYIGVDLNNDHINVGYLFGENRVVCLPFTVGNSGANEFEFLLENAYLNYSVPYVDNSGNFAFAIAPRNGNSYIDHNGADDGNIGDGTLTFVAKGSGLYDISGSVKKILLPGEYYLWLFPNYTTTGSTWVNFQLWYGGTFSATYELSGAAGVVRVKEGDKELICIPMVKDGGTLVQLSATIKNGDSLTYCV